MHSVLSDAERQRLLVADSTTPRPFPKQACFDMKLDFFDALSAGDIDTAIKVFAEDGVLLFPGLRPVLGHALLRRILKIIRQRYDDIAWDPPGVIVCSGDWVATAWTVRGTFKRSGLAYYNEGLSLVRLDDEGRIAVLSDYFKDTLAFTPDSTARGADLN